jgi:hypothetical protein
MNMRLQLRVKFTLAEFDEFLRPISGAAGGQQFIRRCQSMLRGNYTLTGERVLVLDGEDAERWFRYRDAYGSGGFQSRLGRPPKAQKSLFRSSRRVTV